MQLPNNIHLNQKNMHDIHPKKTSCGSFIIFPPAFLTNSINKAHSKLPTPFNNSFRISLCFLHFIYLTGATFDSTQTVSKW